MADHVSRIEKANLKVNGNYIREVPIGASSDNVWMNGNAFPAYQDKNLDTYLKDYVGYDAENFGVPNETIVDKIKTLKNSIDSIEENGKYIALENGTGINSLSIKENKDGDTYFQISAKNSTQENYKKIKANLPLYINNDIYLNEGSVIGKEAAKNWNVSGTTAALSSPIINVNNNELFIGANSSTSAPYKNGSTASGLLKNTDTYIVSGMTTAAMSPSTANNYTQDDLTKVQNNNGMKGELNSTIIKGTGEVKIAIPKTMYVDTDSNYQYKLANNNSYDYKGQSSTVNGYYTYENLIHSGNIKDYMNDNLKMTKLTINNLFVPNSGICTSKGVNANYQYSISTAPYDYTCMVFYCYSPGNGMYLLDYNFPVTSSTKGYVEARIIKLTDCKFTSTEPLGYYLNSSHIDNKLDNFAYAKSAGKISDYVSEETRTIVTAGDNGLSGWGRWIKGTQVVSCSENDMFIILLSAYDSTLSNNIVQFTSVGSPVGSRVEMWATKLANNN